jgi:hypothetical protein
VPVTMTLSRKAGSTDNLNRNSKGNFPSLLLAFPVNLVAKLQRYVLLILFILYFFTFPAE